MNADVRYGATLGVVRFVEKNGKLIGRIDVGMDAGSLRQVCPNSGWRSPQVDFYAVISAS